MHKQDLLLYEQIVSCRSNLYEWDAKHPMRTSALDMRVHGEAGAVCMIRAMPLLLQRVDKRATRATLLLHSCSHSWHGDIATQLLHAVGRARHHSRAQV